MTFVQSAISLFKICFCLSLLFCQAQAVSSAPLERGTLQFSNPESENPTSSVDNEALLLNTQVDFNISGLTARVKVRQTFKNQTAHWLEGKYLFPLPEKSAVDSLKIKIGERIIIGEIKEKQQAKRIYQQAKRTGKKASLVEQHRPNIFSNYVANIAPYETIEITIEYQQDLVFSKDGHLSIRFPMTMTPRYTPQSMLKETMLKESFTDFKQGFQFTPSMFENINLPQKSALQAGNDVTIKVNLNSGIPLESVTSSSHQLTRLQKSRSHYQLSLDGNNNKADRDFILTWKPLAGTEPRAALFSETIDNEHYVSLMVMPPQQATIVNSLPREIVFVIDTSGSMAGESIQQAKQALIYGLSTLQQGDKFNVIEFSNTPNKLFSRTREFFASTHNQAINFVRRLTADGGTEMLSAMDMALNQVNDNGQDKNRVRQVVFLTDGAVNNEAELFQIITQKLADSRLFTVGIGSAPNEFFMKRAAQFGRGTFTFIADIKDSERKIKQLFTEISQPLLTHIEIDWPAHSQVEMWPRKVADLFAGEPLWIKAKLNSLHDLVTIRGRMTNSLWETQLDLSPGQSQAGIAKLWAREKIAFIMNQAHYGRVDDTEKQQIIDIALKHHIVSRFTSLVAVDKTPSRINEALLEKSMQQVKPKGSQAPQMQYARTAIDLYITPQQALYLLLLAIAGLIMLHFEKRRV